MKPNKAAASLLQSDLFWAKVYSVDTLLLYLLNQLPDLRQIFTNMMHIFSAINEA